MSSWRKSSSMRPATRRARTGRRRSIFTTRASEPWKCQKSRHQWKNEKTVQPKLYRSLFPHDVFLSGAAFRNALFVGGGKRDRTADLMTASCDRFVILSVFTSNPSVPSAKSAGFCKVLSIASTRFRAHLGQNLGQGKTVPPRIRMNSLTCSSFCVGMCTGL